MFYGLYKTWRPGVFQGHNKTDRYFEGWYFKSVDASGEFPLAVIPGISLAGADSHAFIQVFDGKARKARYFRFPRDSFCADRKQFKIAIGGNHFDANGFSIDLHNETEGGAAVKAELSFENIHPWPIKAFSPGAMGWYAFVPAMECYHGVLSFNHRVRGWAEIGGERRFFDGGKGYIEKDWGMSMPSAWIWMQTNHFEEPEASLFVSVARIPWRRNFFTGHIASLYLKGALYPFATYTGARLSLLETGEREVALTFEDKRHVLKIRGHRQPGVDLPAPKLGEMSAKVNESLQSSVEVRLSTKDGAVVFEGTGEHAGLECVGNLTIKGG